MCPSTHLGTGHGTRDATAQGSADVRTCARTCAWGGCMGAGKKTEGEVVRRGDEGAREEHTHTNNTHASRTAVLGPSSGPQALYRPYVRRAATKGCRRRARGGQQAAGDSHLPDEAVLREWAMHRWRVSVHVNVHELRLGFSSTTRNLASQALLKSSRYTQRGACLGDRDCDSGRLIGGAEGGGGGRRLSVLRVGVSTGH